jgi:hypothetical protein
VYVSAELIGVVIAAFAVVVTTGLGMFSGFAWVVRRIDGVEGKLTARIDEGDRRLSDRIDGLEGALSARIDEGDRRLWDRIDSLESSIRQEMAGLRGEMTDVRNEMTEVKIAVARIEGPLPHLIVTR